MNTKQIIDEAILLPVEERTQVVDSLLRSLNSPESKIDTEWILEARKRLNEMRSGTAGLIPGKLVFEKILKKFN
jgi:hypothetical protein